MKSLQVITARPEFAKAKIILRNSATGLFYAAALGGFAEADVAKATVADGIPGAAFIKAHFANPATIEYCLAPEVAPAFTAADLPKLAAAIAAYPKPENAHLNKHINGAIRPRKTHHGRDGSRSYRFGDYRIELTVSRTSRNQGCGYRKTSTHTNFDLINHAAGEHSYLNSGGLRAALAAIIKREMKRHGLA